MLIETERKTVPSEQVFRYDATAAPGRANVRRAFSQAMNAIGTVAKNKTIRALIPTPVKRTIKRAARVLDIGWQRYCPICEQHARRFLPHGPAGTKTRQNAKCPFCLTSERHRLDWLFLQRKTDLFDGRTKRFLHIAPEAAMERLFRSVPRVQYLSGDLDSPVAMELMDITDIRRADGSFEVVYCSHVLEHVPNDRKAIAEFFRILVPGGWAVLQVPISVERTWEDLTITDPEERRRVYGHPGHVRNCGPDYADRMRDVGFEVTVFRTGDVLNEAERIKMAIQADRRIFFARRPA